MTKPLSLALAAAWRARRAFVSAITCMTAAKAAALAVPWLAGAFTTLAISRDDSGAVLAFAAGALVARIVLNYAGSMLALRGSETVNKDVRQQLYEQLQSRRLDYFHRRRLGEVVAMFGMDVTTVTNFVSDTVVRVAPVAVSLIGALGLMLWHDAVLGLTALAAVPLVIVTGRVMGRHIRRHTVRATEAHAKTQGILQENLTVLRAIRAFGRERREADRYREAQRDLVDATLAQERGYLRTGAATQILASAAGLGLVALGGWRVSRGALTPGELVTALLYGWVLVGALVSLADTYSYSRMAMGASERLDAAFSAAADASETDGQPLPAGGGRIDISDLCFQYPDGTPVLEGLSLSVTAGETIALIGPNGAGKTTLAQLLMRFYEPDSGAIAIDGTDIRGVRVGELRRAIGLVPQTDLLVFGSVRDNIAYGRPDATNEQIEAAARAAGAHDFVSALDDGYASVIGERGVTLSGGQRQRLSLARALLCDPRVVVLDEATAMFDPDGEAALLTDNEAWLRERTVIIITHRPALLAAADRVLRLDGGRLVDAIAPTDARAAR